MVKVLLKLVALRFKDLSVTPAVLCAALPAIANNGVHLVLFQFSFLDAGVIVSYLCFVSKAKAKKSGNSVTPFNDVRKNLRECFSVKGKNNTICILDYFSCCKLNFFPYI